MTDPLLTIGEHVRELVEINGDGFWSPCSGCYETEDGYPVGSYPHSAVLRCVLGGGCSECGGIGAVWDNTDYADMAEWMIRQDRNRDNVAKILIEHGKLPAYQAGEIADLIMALDEPDVTGDQSKP
ncbi:hypothetical protein [Sphingomonas sp. SRS2]|uniref:hypothetical protein n=1 Tax=Sphingomonas sp. SRS2 TaxID=133190 RepID=UPI0006184915|nr:hypothetical protein [Sphingomonas sp. SRS2]KKC24903.1 hypothetical protein WP12_16900 [Sphingomonas sp. SRS2]